MKSLNIDKIAIQTLPKDFDSHVGISCTSNDSNFNFSYFFDRDISSIQTESYKNPSVKLVHNSIEKSVELKFDAQYKSDSIQTTLIYNPLLLNSNTMVNQIRNLYKSKHFTIPLVKIENDYSKGMNIFIKNKIRPFAGQKNSDVLIINVRNSYTMISNILCSNIEFKFPLFRFSILTSAKQSIFSMNSKIHDFKSCLSFVFYNNHFLSFLPEICIDNILKGLLSSIKCKSLNKIPFKNDKIGFKYDTGNKFFLLRHENCIKTAKGCTFDTGFSFVYRAGSIQTASGIKYTGTNGKTSISIGKTEDMKLNVSASHPFKEDIALLSAGFCIGPTFSYPSKNFFFNINFYD